VAQGQPLLIDSEPTPANGCGSHGVAGRKRWLGSADSVPREKAASARRKIAQGLNPIDKRKREGSSGPRGRKQGNGGTRRLRSRPAGGFGGSFLLALASELFYSTLATAMVKKPFCPRRIRILSIAAITSAHLAACGRVLCPDDRRLRRIGPFLQHFRKNNFPFACFRMRSTKSFMASQTNIRQCGRACSIPLHL